MFILAAALLSGCAPDLGPGEWGTFRYFGEIQGEPPMRLIPPVTDRDGNVYVLYGNRERAENAVYVGSALGGWSGGCQAHRGSFGIHGFVGRATSRAWYWSGDALAVVDGETGGCREVLSTDPVTGTQLTFLGVAPLVFETPSRTRLLAMVRGATDDIPYYVRVDLDEESYLDPKPFSPADAEDITVLGTGADPATRQGAFVVSYLSGGRQVTVYFVNEDGNLISSVPIDLGGAPEAYSIQGFVQFSDTGLGAALFSDDSLLIFNNQSGGIKAVSGFDPVGIVRWDGELYITGLQAGSPVAAKMDANGSVGSPQPWKTAETAAGALSGGVNVLDERSNPSRAASWPESRSAIGSWPFLSAHPLDVYTTTSTGWLVAGPGYSATTEPVTAVAFAPVGFAIP